MESLRLVRSYISKAKHKARERLKKKKKEDVIKSEIPPPPSQSLSVFSFEGRI